ncbi:MAG: pyridoxal phosphate-dependent aminotransferase [Gammaproteobacteria bacterium]|nr:pyridoxal phosphate-dependent aminotransferase [Gammaproteobacteria bacterium]MDH3971350.1 pyridoxal phosphate-dependent aminotransferase [Gammaproteobacteria bacterium]MDH3985614.1 pyridoxal phosphate-dependent aminotransferase [Gammaproteobacteria bacterium]
MTIRQATRMQLIQPFHVMALLARARELEAAGRSVIHMEIGEPDFVTPQPLIDAGIKALQDGHTHYTPATGLWALREKIAGFYRTRYGVSIEPERVVVTPGASSALQLVLAALVDSGDTVLLSDPGYPCNRNFVHLLNGKPVAIPVGAANDYQPLPQQVSDSWTAQARALLIASPSNPTGTLLDEQTLREYHAITDQKGGSLIVDEIYHGLTYDGPASTALAVSDDIFVINSFSKYFGMTGWRLGWLVAPREVVADIDKLAQNLFLAAPTPAQYAALRAFDEDVLEILDERRDEFRARRDYLLPALRDIGFDIPVNPSGAFYLYANCSRFTDDSFSFTSRLLEEAGVAITPGIDFGTNRPEHHVRFAYTTSLENLQEGVQRLAQAL